MVKHLNFLIILLLFASSVDLNAQHNDKWFRVNYLGFKIGYHKWSINFIEVAYGDLSNGLGIGGTLFEIENSTYNFLPAKLFIAKPLGNTTGPVENGFGGPLLFPWGYQYPGAIYLQMKISLLGIKKSSWCLTSEVGLGFEKSIYQQAGSIGVEFGYNIDFLPLRDEENKYLYAVFQYNFSSWARVEKNSR
ncbi:MAG: hypothetical protein XD76_1267 [candidate division TA06 bacterium 32_111]|uniref:Outer membrane protein beta-barrel domain-containing protein n=2 Tax=Bacteria candidate phyla TaxID=1783234 RepID=A0A117M6E9_UNCT6|nr:MAG: hypothetical protein XD76_1267 [candidate division TA06 bacterium 32_111]KUK86980.1 MAG: hypothetical protein XE03_1069 [candidate division TA06 bacterium 34_109]HAF07272.1 hypothetical protein [candidate division WOR-3 bacterium]HCP16121.1 hypothetical protein [candidate division WOR-3 bacterium]